MFTAYVDCSAGLTFPMLLGALIDLGVDLAGVEAALAGLPVTGWRLHARPVLLDNGAAVGVSIEGGRLAGESEVWYLPDLMRLVEATHFEPVLARQIGHVLNRWWRAAAAVRRVAPESYPMSGQELTQALLGAVCTCAALDQLAVTRVCAESLPLTFSHFNNGEAGGVAESAHVLELAKGLPVHAPPAPEAVTTALGAAILGGLCVQFGPLPAMKLVRTGYGVGGNETESRTMRVLLGEEESAMDAETVTVVEASIDDMNPQFFGYLAEQLTAAGALDVCLVPVHMKKYRPGVMIHVIVRPADARAVAQVIFTESTTIGLRTYEVSRLVLRRQMATVETNAGPVRVKVAGDQMRVVNVQPEYEDCVRVARSSGRPLKQVYDEAKGKAVALYPKNIQDINSP